MRSRCLSPLGGLFLVLCLSSSTSLSIPRQRRSTGGRSLLSSSSPSLSPRNQKKVTALRAGAAAAAEESGGGTATIPNEVFNLVKSIVGAGVLSLPAGIAAFGNAPSAVIPATALIGVVGIISAYTFQMIGRVCAASKTDSYSDAWDKVVGTKTSWIIALSCLVDCFAGNLSYSMILADTGVALLKTCGIAATRTQSLLGITGGVLLPLCFMKNLSSLAPFSLVGIIGMLYTTVAMAIRYFGKAYDATASVGGAAFVGAAAPAFGTAGAASVMSPQALILMCMLSNAYIAHFLAPKMYSELKNNTLGRFNQVIGWSFGISVLLYSIISALGFLTFGAASNGLILNNYSTKDVLMSFSRIAVAVSITCSYPLLFVGTRDGVLDLFKVSAEKRSSAMLNKITVGIMAVVTLMASKLTDLGLVASVGGATFGTALVFVYPVIMFRRMLKDRGDLKGNKEGTLASAIAILGILMGAIGTKLALSGVDV